MAPPRRGVAFSQGPGFVPPPPKGGVAFSQGPGFVPPPTPEGGVPPLWWWGGGGGGLGSIRLGQVRLIEVRLGLAGEARLGQVKLRLSLILTCSEHQKAKKCDTFHKFGRQGPDDEQRSSTA